MTHTEEPDTEKQVREARARVYAGYVRGDDDEALVDAISALIDAKIARALEQRDGVWEARIQRLCDDIEAKTGIRP